jgi:hypothetical protein
MKFDPNIRDVDVISYDLSKFSVEVAAIYGCDSFVSEGFDTGFHLLSRFAVKRHMPPAGFAVLAA